MNIYDFLNKNKILYERHDHPAVFTCEQALEQISHLPGAKIKNLFLRDEKGKRHFLVVVGYNKSVDLKALSALLDAKRLGFASPERLKKYLDIEPGSVTILALLNDLNHNVELIIDKEIWQEETFQCHPLINTSTLVISKENLEKFLEETGHEVRLVEIKDRGSV